MECPECHSHQIHKNGYSKGQQNYICLKYGRQVMTESGLNQRYYISFITIMAIFIIILFNPFIIYQKNLGYCQSNNFDFN